MRTPLSPCRAHNCKSFLPSRNNGGDASSVRKGFGPRAENVIAPILSFGGGLRFPAAPEEGRLNGYHSGFVPKPQAVCADCPHASLPPGVQPPLALDSRAETVLSYAPKGIVLSANDGMDNALAQVDPALLSAGVPVLALGGMVPALCRFYGGEASPSACPRGAVTLGLEHDPLFTNISGGERVLRSLSDLTLPESLLPLATATERPIGFRHRTLPLYAVQYPIERNDPDAAQLLFNFASFICGAAASWDEDAMIQLAVERIREAAPEGRVLCAVSGGVDSAVCAVWPAWP